MKSVTVVVVVVVVSVVGQVAKKKLFPLEFFNRRCNYFHNLGLEKVLKSAVEEYIWIHINGSV